MTQAPSIDNTAVAGLLRLLEESSASQCAELRSRADEKIAAIKHQAYRQARERVRSAVAEERTRYRQEIGRVSAAVETDLRRRALRHDARLVEAGRDLLDQALRRRWQEPEAREAWLNAALNAGRQVLLGREWRMSCPPDWPEAERKRARELAAERHGVSLEIVEDPDLVEGLRVGSLGVMADLSVAGLLADLAAIDGDLLQIHRGITRGERE